MVFYTDKSAKNTKSGGDMYPEFTHRYQIFDENQRVIDSGMKAVK
jgi:hypothetical protein